MTGSPQSADGAAEAPGGSPAEEAHCTGCGRPLSVCSGCGRALDPPRFCSRCGRRMAVLVTPGGYSASCRDHGQSTDDL
ncbi:MAG: biotin synthase auxiliary protein BsaP [Acidimicrobiales bacterium]